MTCTSHGVTSSQTKPARQIANTSGQVLKCTPAKYTPRGVPSVVPTTWVTTARTG